MNMAFNISIDEKKKRKSKYNICMKSITTFQSNQRFTKYMNRIGSLCLFAFYAWAHVERRFWSFLNSYKLSHRINIQLNTWTATAIEVILLFVFFSFLFMRKYQWTEHIEFWVKISYLHEWSERFRSIELNETERKIEGSLKRLRDFNELQHIVQKYILK